MDTTWVVSRFFFKPCFVFFRIGIPIPTYFTSEKLSFVADEDRRPPTRRRRYRGGYTVYDINVNAGPATLIRCDVQDWSGAINT